MLIPGAMALCGLGLIGALHLLPARDARDVTVIFAPQISFGEAAKRVNAAGAVVLSTGESGNIITARLRENTPPKTLSDVGAWLILSASAPEICTARARTPGQAIKTTNS